MAPPPRLRLRVTAVAEKLIRGGHPWAFADSVNEQNRAGETGELAVIYDRRDRFLAIGLYDADSPLRVRVLHAGKPQTLDVAWWRMRFQTALDRRAGLFDAQTTGYRWINGESDGWPGLVLDRYADALVLKIYTAAWLPRLNEVAALVRDVLQPQRLVLRSSRNIQLTASSSRFGWRNGQDLAAPDPAAPPAPAVDAPRDLRGTLTPPSTVQFLESGLRFEADIVNGQKTGFFLDQRENRRIVESLATRRAVLNAFSFSGGFSVYAARGGATSVTDLDISPYALDGARRNFALNRPLPAVAGCRHLQVQANGFEWLAQAPPQAFDLIVLDPPSLAKREAERERAIHAYRQVNGDAIRRLAPGGILLSASCSAHVSAAEFTGAVRAAARESGRAFAELRTTGHPPDHPATFAEAQVLKAIYLRF